MRAISKKSLRKKAETPLLTHNPAGYWKRDLPIPYHGDIDTGRRQSDPKNQAYPELSRGEPGREYWIARASARRVAIAFLEKIKQRAPRLYEEFRLLAEEVAPD